jgi:hypothetical protein
MVASISPSDSSRGNLLQGLPPSLLQLGYRRLHPHGERDGRLAVCARRRTARTVHPGAACGSSFRIERPPTAVQQLPPFHSLE